MVIPDFSGNFTNPLNCKTGSKGVVISEGEIESKKSMKGDDYDQLTIEVEVNGKRLKHSIRMLEGRKLQDVWGADTKDWIGRKFETTIINYTSFGQQKQAVELVPVKE